MGRALRALPLLLLTAGCSPLYGYRSAAGHAGLLWRERSIEETIKDPSTSPGRREKLKLTLDVRRFAVERLSLAPSRDYKTWTPVDGAVSWLVYACPKDSLTPKTIFGYPYKGHFRKIWADKEAAAWERMGFDATVVPASAYNTPLPIADPLPSSVLDYGPGDLAELLIHEFTHGTVNTGDQSFNEAMASWVGERGADQFLTEQFGETSPERTEWKLDAARAETRAVLFEELAKLLTELYASGASCADKLVKREALFTWAREQGAKRSIELPAAFNNAVVASRQVYRGEPARFKALFEKNRSDWKKTIDALKALDRRDPWAALRAEIPRN